MIKLPKVSKELGSEESFRYRCIYSTINILFVISLSYISQCVFKFLICFFFFFLILLLTTVDTFKSIELTYRSNCAVFTSFSSLVTCQEIFHHVQRFLKRFGETRWTRVVGRVKWGDAEDYLIIMDIVGTSVSFWSHWSIAHEAIGRTCDLR